MYTFVKIKNTYNNLNIVYKYVLEAHSVNDIIEHTKKYLYPQIEDGIQDSITGSRSHPSTMWRSATEQLARINEVSLMDSSIQLENCIIQGKVKNLLKFGKIYLSKNGSYFLPSKTMKIVATKKCETLDYPDNFFTKKDIKISKWPKGIHWYVRIGEADVREKDGTNKWLSYNRAMEVACSYLEVLNK
jgi:hypothetical protein